MPGDANLDRNPATTSRHDFLDPAPATDTDHLRALEEIRAQVGDLFKRNAEFCSRSPHRVLLLDWPLDHQLPRMAQRSNKIAITFGRPWLDEFISSSASRRIELLAEVRTVIRFRMRDFEEGRDLSISHEASADTFQISLR